ncbi:hypothetical protein [Algoriphagus namhaensis]
MKLRIRIYSIGQEKGVSSIALQAVFEGNDSIRFRTGFLLSWWIFA